MTSPWPVFVDVSETGMHFCVRDLTVLPMHLLAKDMDG